MVGPANWNWHKEEVYQEYLWHCISWYDEVYIAGKRHSELYSTVAPYFKHMWE